MIFRFLMYLGYQLMTKLMECGYVLCVRKLRKIVGQ